MIVHRWRRRVAVRAIGFPFLRGGAAGVPVACGHVRMSEHHGGTGL